MAGVISKVQGYTYWNVCHVKSKGRHAVVLKNCHLTIYPAVKIWFVACISRGFYVEQFGKDMITDFQSFNH